jgi:hypothetical protein
MTRLKLLSAISRNGESTDVVPVTSSFDRKTKYLAVGYTPIVSVGSSDSVLSGDIYKIKDDSLELLFTANTDTGFESSSAYISNDGSTFITASDNNITFTPTVGTVFKLNVYTKSNHNYVLSNGVSFNDLYSALGDLGGLFTCDDKYIITNYAYSATTSIIKVLSTCDYSVVSELIYPGLPVGSMSVVKLKERYYITLSTGLFDYDTGAYTGGFQCVVIKFNKKKLKFLKALNLDNRSVIDSKIINNEMYILIGSDASTCMGKPSVYISPHTSKLNNDEIKSYKFETHRKKFVLRSERNTDINVRAVSLAEDFEIVSMNPVISGGSGSSVGSVITVGCVQKVDQILAGNVRVTTLSNRCKFAFSGGMPSTTVNNLCLYEVC